MNVKLIGMSNEELIMWAVINAPISEKAMRFAFPGIEEFCAQNPVGLPDFIDTLVRMARHGIGLRKSIESIKERCA